MKMTMTQSKKGKRAAEKHVTETYRGYGGPGWTLSITGRRRWVKKMVQKWVPEIQKVDLAELEKYIEEAKNLARLRRCEAIEHKEELRESFYNGQLAVLEGVWVRFDQLFGEGSARGERPHERRA